MELGKISKGIVFYLPDRARRNFRGGENHQCLVIGGTSNIRTGACGYVQVMSITSMANKEVKKEIPILMSDDTIGYLVPYNIFSYVIDEFSDFTDRKGFIQDTEYYTTEEFYRFLMDIYLDCHGYGIRDRNDVAEEIRNYQDWFFETYHDKMEYRFTEKKINKIKSIPVPDKSLKGSFVHRNTGTNDNINVPLEETSEDTAKNEEKFSSLNIASSYSTYNNSEEDDEETELVYTEGNINTIQIPEIFNNNIDVGEKFLKSLPLVASQFNREQIEIFMDLYDRVEKKKISEIMQIQITKLYKLHNQVSNIAKTYGYIKKKEESTNKYKKPINIWDDGELIDFLKVFDEIGTKNMATELNCSLQSVYQRKYNVKKEMKKRRLLETV